MSITFRQLTDSRATTSTSPLTATEHDNNLLALLNDGIQVYDNVSALKATNPTGWADGTHIYLRGYYNDGDGGGGLLYWDSSSVATPNDGTVIQSTGVATGRWVRPIKDSIVKASWFGFLESNAEDVNSTALSNIETAVSAGDTISLDAGVFLVQDQFNLPQGVSLVCSDGVCEFNGEASGASIANSLINVAGATLESLPNLSGNVSKGDTQLDFASDHGLSVGDVFIIYDDTNGSFNPFRDNYNAGEYCEVAEVVDSNSVRLVGGLFDSYQSSDVTLHKYTSNDNTVISGVKAVVADDVTYGAIQFRYVTNYTLINVEAQGSSTSAFRVFNCYDFTISDCKAHQKVVGNGNLQYGIIFAACQQIFANGTFKGFRHGVVMTSVDAFSIPNRLLTVSGVIVKVGTTNGTVSIADFHGNCEYCTYSDFTTIGAGGVNIAGNNNTIRNWTCYSSDGVVAYGREILGMNHSFYNCDIYASGNPNAIGRGVFDIGGNSTAMSANTSIDGNILLSGVRVHAPEAEGFIVYFRNRGFTGDWGLILSGVSIDSPLATLQAIRLRNTSGGAASVFRQDGMLEVNNNSGGVYNFDGSPTVSGVEFSGTESLTTPSGAASSFTHDVTFPYALPKTPAIQVSLGQFTTGTDRIAAYVTSASASGFTITVTTTDGSNFDATDFNLTCYYSAKIQE